MTTMTDHPRSRGVYVQLGDHHDHHDGSSPLARGLHPHRGHDRRKLRIIPARAGFTMRSTVSASTTRDHPRSRGVYRPPTPLSLRPPGSSPLARGLPQGKSHGQVREGIIPARAGFTTAATVTPRISPDHPRSRGVYMKHARRPRDAMGSSPLARGLPPRATRPPPTPRIIPARAGFTAPRDTEIRRKQDHPRSRGVYSPWTGAMRMTSGSSPLARGLPRFDPAPGRDAGIIPARAGFTPRPPSQR